MPVLNQQQREFLIHLRDNHRSLGWRGSIDSILNRNAYDYDFDSNLDITDILADYKKLLRGIGIGRYGKPTKYLKI